MPRAPCPTLAPGPCRRCTSTRPSPVRPSSVRPSPIRPSPAGPRGPCSAGSPRSGSRPATRPGGRCAGRPAKTPRMPGTRPASACTSSTSARSSPRTITSVSISSISGSWRSTAERWWKAAVTRESGSRAAACSAALPSSGFSAYAPFLSKPSGLTQSTTSLPASSSRRASRVLPCPSHGTATITRSLRRAHSALSAPSTPCPSSAAAACARSAAREPMITFWPALARR